MTNTSPDLTTARVQDIESGESSSPFVSKTDVNVCPDGHCVSAGAPFSILPPCDSCKQETGTFYIPLLDETTLTHPAEHHEYIPDDDRIPPALPDAHLETVRPHPLKEEREDHLLMNPDASDSPFATARGRVSRGRGRPKGVRGRLSGKPSRKGLGREARDATVFGEECPADREIAAKVSADCDQEPVIHSTEKRKRMPDSAKPPPKMACRFCRGRKIACGPDSKSSEGEQVPCR